MTSLPAHPSGRRLGLVIDLDICVGCHACAVNCKEWNSGGVAAPQVHAPVSINVSALDSVSVARFFNDNSRHMLRAINDAVKRGAHLGLRS